MEITTRRLRMITPNLVMTQTLVKEGAFSPGRRDTVLFDNECAKDCIKKTVSNGRRRGGMQKA